MNNNDTMPVKVSRIVALCRALGNPNTVMALEGDTVEDALVEMATNRLTCTPHHQVVAKQTKNEGRNWPDWRTAPADRAIDHVRNTPGQGESGPIVGHKTFHEKDGSTRHEPLYESESKALMASLDAAKKRRAELMPTEQDAASAMWQAWYRLKELGWRETCYGPTNIQVQLIEPGSSGIHRGTRWKDWPDTTWWIDGDWPSNPCLFKPMPADCNADACTVIPALHTVHCPNGPVHVCANHLHVVVRGVHAFLGANCAVSPAPADAVCSNCANEAQIGC